jgi:hypothetical protein
MSAIVIGLFEDAADDGLAESTADAATNAADKVAIAPLRKVVRM